MWPQKWGRFFGWRSASRREENTRGCGMPEGIPRYKSWPDPETNREHAAFLQYAPHKVGQEGEEQQHEDAAHPDQKVRGHFGIVDLLFVHISE
jgi:hypothetical protein